MEQNLTEEQVRTIVKDEMSKNYRSGSPFVAPHRHDGIANLNIQQKDVIPNNKYVGGIQLNSLGNDGVDGHQFQFTFGQDLPNPVSYPTQIQFYGFAFSGTDKAIINGTAQFGNAYSLNGTTSYIKNDNGITQCCNSMYITSGGSARVAESPLYLAYVADTGGTEILRLTVTSFNNNKITITGTFTAGWVVNSSFIIT